MASRWFAKRRKRCRGARALDQVGVPFEDRDLVGIGYATGSGTPSSMESEHPLFKQKFSMGVGGVTEGRIAARVDDITLTLHLLTGVTQENCDRDWLRRYCGGARSSIACTTTCPPRRSMARAQSAPPLVSRFFGPSLPRLMCAARTRLEVRVEATKMLAGRSRVSFAN
jgi:hypothetical protein